MPGQVENQIFAGQSGALIVGDDRSLLPRAYGHDTAHTVVCKHVELDKSGHTLQNTNSTSILLSNPTVRLVDAQLRPVLSMLPPTLAQGPITWS
jgi:suppressor of ftsI